MESRNKVDGAAKVAVGKLEGAVGEAIGDTHVQAEGAALEIEGRLQQAVGTVQEALGGAADKTRAAVSSVSGAYGKVSGRTRELRRRVARQPFLSLAVAAAGGLVLGLALGGRGPKIIYVKPRTRTEPRRS